MIMDKGEAGDCDGVFCDFDHEESSLVAARHSHLIILVTAVLEANVSPRACFLCDRIEHLGFEMSSTIRARHCGFACRCLATTHYRPI